MQNTKSKTYNLHVLQDRGSNGAKIQMLLVIPGTDIIALKSNMSRTVSVLIQQVQLTFTPQIHNLNKVGLSTANQLIITASVVIKELELKNLGFDRAQAKVLKLEGEIGRIPVVHHTGALVQDFTILEHLKVGIRLSE